MERKRSLIDSDSGSRFWASQYAIEFIQPVTERFVFINDSPASGVLQTSILKRNKAAIYLVGDQKYAYYDPKHVIASVGTNVRSSILTLQINQAFSRISDEQRVDVTRAMLFKASAYQKRLVTLIPEKMVPLFSSNMWNFLEKWKENPQPQESVISFMRSSL